MKIIGIEAAVCALRAGELVAIPTETVYGLGADAANEAAVHKIFQVKGRPHDHPLIVHIANSKALAAYAREVPPYALALARQCWPGPLTLVCKKQAQVSSLLTGGQETIGVRVPNHPVALALLQAFGGGVAAPSANRFTHVSPTSVSAVEEELGDKVEWILEGGECAIGLESTIIDVSGEEGPVLLRPGMISPKTIAEISGRAVKAVLPLAPHARAPGMSHLHYAPQTRACLLSMQDIKEVLPALPAEAFPIALMTHTDFPLSLSRPLHRVRMPDHAPAYAHDVYSVLRKLDRMGLKRIVIETLPPSPEWDAIRDRLLKASSRHIYP